MQYLVQWEVTIVQEGYLGGRHSDFHRPRGSETLNNDGHVSSSMTFTRFLRMKRVRKFNNNYEKGI